MKTSVYKNAKTHEDGKRAYYEKEELRDHQVCEWCGKRNKWNGLFEHDNCGVLVCSYHCHKQYFSMDI
jgi:hypothetical protein